MTTFYRIAATTIALLAISHITQAQNIYSKGFNLIVLGDTQPQTEEQFQRLEEDIFPEIRAILSEYDTTDEIPEAILITGDVVWDTMEFMPRIKSLFSTLGVPLYTVIGNHDYDRAIEGRERRAAREYRHNFGPLYYATTLGSSRFIALDNILYNSYNDYSIGLDRKQMRWLRRVISETPSDMRLIVAMHAPAVDYRSGELLPYAREIVEATEGRELHFVTGHRHRNNTCDIAPNVVEHSVAQVNGNLWFAPLCADGTPRGVLLIEERDNSLSWFFRTLGQEADYQLRAWREGEVAGNEEYIVVKAWGVDSRWSILSSEDGNIWHEMEAISIVDPDYIDYVEQEASYDEVIMQRLRNSARPSEHYFRYRRSSPEKSVTIEATDRFGRCYTLVIP